MLVQQQRPSSIVVRCAEAWHGRPRTRGMCVEFKTLHSCLVSCRRRTGGRASAPSAAAVASTTFQVSAIKERHSAFNLLLNSGGGALSCQGVGWVHRGGAGELASFAGRQRCCSWSFAGGTHSNGVVSLCQLLVGWKVAETLKGLSGISHSCCPPTLNPPTLNRLRSLRPLLWPRPAGHARALPMTACRIATAHEPAWLQLPLGGVSSSR